MLTLELDIGMNTNVEAQEILHLLTKNEDFSITGRELRIF
jgi:hypothetical protein